MQYFLPIPAMAQRTAYSGLAMATLCLIFAGSAKGNNSDYSVQYKIENETWVGANLDFDLGTNSVSVNGSVSHSSGTAMPMFGTCLYGEVGALTCTASLGYGIGVTVVIGDGAVGSITFDPPEAEQRTYSNMSPELITEDRKHLFTAADVSVVVVQPPDPGGLSGTNPWIFVPDPEGYIDVSLMQITTDRIDGDQNCGIDPSAWKWKHYAETNHITVRSSQSEYGCLRSMNCRFEWQNPDGSYGNTGGRPYATLTVDTAVIFRLDSRDFRNRPLYLAMTDCSIYG